MTELEKRQIAAEYVGHLVLNVLEQMCGDAHQLGNCAENGYSVNTPDEKRIVAEKNIEAERFYCTSDVLELLDISKSTFHRWRSAQFFPNGDNLIGDRPVWRGETILSWTEWCNEFNLKSASDVNSDTTPFIDWA